uniref:Transcriptional regulator of various polyols utilization, AraC family n=1 Tax=uncultured Thiotrichaceae bacterium TaxID=298394 RepID=A0A6S6UID1_9GAMM|nr:MAG: Transcriptional regulator of various polyols utilization, AraC family [uncultured Thiotrichaceae bacterium]
MNQQAATPFKHRAPELELDFQRNSNLGYEAGGGFGTIRCLEHGVPNSLVRWHYHEEYELHLIVETSGKLFVGDYIGRFEPGNLVLTGPRLPHNWISTDVPEQGVPIRDRVLQFSDEPLRKSSELIPELRDLLSLLERASHGIEFIGISEQVSERMIRIKSSTGVVRFTEFLQLLHELSEHNQYNLLSSARLQSFDDDDSLQQISEVVDYITENYGTPFSMADICKHFGMSSSHFSRYFQRATGNTFTDFVNRMRINRACVLLMETEQYISTICYSVGFNNIANFNRRFMDIKGMTPSEFRRQGQARFG